MNESRINSMAFTPKEVEDGLHIKLINFLLDYNVKSESSVNDIRIWTDGYCTVVDWINIDPDIDCEKFEFVDEEHEVLLRYTLPDKSTAYIFDDEKDEVLNKFLEENPEYKKDKYGMWHNTKEE